MFSNDSTTARRLGLADMSVKDATTRLEALAAKAPPRAVRAPGHNPLAAALMTAPELDAEAPTP